MSGRGATPTGIPDAGSAPGWRELSLVAATYLLAALWFLWPLPTHFADHTAYWGADVPGISADGHLQIWILAWGAHALLTDPLHVFHANAFHPATASLAYSDHLLGHLPWFAPWYWATGNPILAGNALIVTYLVAAALAMYMLARRWCPIAPSLIAGFVYGFCPLRFWTLPYLQLMPVQYLPLLLLFTDRWLAAGRRRDLVLLSVAGVLQVLSSAYLAYVAFAVLGTAAAVCLVAWRARLDRRRLTGLVLAAGLVAASFAVTSLPYLTLRQLGVVDVFDAGPARGVLTSTGLRPFIALQTIRKYLTEQSVGPIGAVLVLLGLWPSGPRRRWAAALGACLVLVGLVLAAGPGIGADDSVFWSPYRLLQQWVPGFATIRVPERFVAVTQLGFATLAALGATRLSETLRLRGGPPSIALAIGACLAIAGLERMPALAQHPETTPRTLPPAYAWLARHGEGRPLLELPQPSFTEAARRMVLSTYHWLPIVDGYSGYYPRTAGYLHGIAASLPDEAALQELVDVVDIGWILVHLDKIPDPRPWIDGALPAGLERVASWPGALLLRVTRAPVHDIRARLLSTRETLGGVPLAPLGPDCAGRLVGALPERWRTLAPLPVEVTVHNDSPVSWPGQALLPRHVVHVRARLLRGDGTTARESWQPLGADLEPGGSTEVALELPPLAIPGDYQLVIDLIQLLDTPLAACGAGELRAPLQVQLGARTG